MVKGVMPSAVEGYGRAGGHYRTDVQPVNTIGQRHLCNQPDKSQFLGGVDHASLGFDGEGDRFAKKRGIGNSAGKLLRGLNLSGFPDHQLEAMMIVDELLQLDPGDIELDRPTIDDD